VIQVDSEFQNLYDDDVRSEAYAGLELSGTYYLAYRDLPEIIRAHVRGTRALDFGCGAGRSTRFLRGLGFDPVGADISETMLAHARTRDPNGDYRLIPDGDFSTLRRHSFDLILAAFPFDNIPTLAKKVASFRALADLLDDRGRIITVVSSPELYVHEWRSFSTRDFPENRTARCGDPVQIVMLDVEDRRPVEDILWTDEAYADVHERAGLRLIESCRPLGEPSEPFVWVSETRIAPWVIHVLATKAG
jgi:SAM-dependent methyltransferase